MSSSTPMTWVRLLNSDFVLSPTLFESPISCLQFSQYHVWDLKSIGSFTTFCNVKFRFCTSFDKILISVSLLAVNPLTNIWHLNLSDEISCSLNFLQSRFTVIAYITKSFFDSEKVCKLTFHLQQLFNSKSTWFMLLVEKNLNFCVYIIAITFRFTLI